LEKKTYKQLVLEGLLPFTFFCQVTFVGFHDLQALKVYAACMKGIGISCLTSITGYPDIPRLPENAWVIAGLLCQS